MRAERAEARAQAAHAELQDFSRKSAREIAQLKVLLAEKDAALMGVGGGRGAFGGYGRGGAGGAFDGPYDTLLPRAAPPPLAGVSGGGGFGMQSPRPAPAAQRSPHGAEVHRTGARAGGAALPHLLACSPFSARLLSTQLMRRSAVRVTAGAVRRNTPPLEPIPQDLYGDRRSAGNRTGGGKSAFR